MKHKSIIFVVTLIISLLCACSASLDESKTPAPSESARIPYETLDTIRGELEEFFSGHSGISISVLDTNDGEINTSLNAEGMVLQVAFPDFANAMVVQSQELTEKHGLLLSQVSITFTDGEDNLMNWRTSDFISGYLLDSYNGNDLLISDQTIENLVDRYGAMDWFYPLSSDT